MRTLRLLSAVLVTASLLSWSLAPLPAAAQAPAAAAPVAVNSPAAIVASVNVTTYDDQWDDSTKPASAGSGCSLREALEKAYNFNGNQGCGLTAAAADIININIPAGTYVLKNTDELPYIPSGKIINIDGQGVVIDGGYEVDVRYTGIFHVEGGALNLMNVTLQNGNRPGGGAIWLAHGTVRADHVIFEHNQAAASSSLAQSGGAILNEAGDISVTNSYFGDNAAVDGGGAVSTQYGYYFHDIFFDNRAGRGGAFYDPGGNGQVIIDQSKFEDNKSRPTLDPPGSHSTYASYSDKYGGGAIDNYGNLQVFRSVLKNNHTELDQGGGAVNNHGALQMGDCVITGNDARAEGSGDNNSSIKYSFGGAIINYGTLDLIRCSVHGNTADYVGAILNYGAGALSLYNSTVSDNHAVDFYGGLANDLPTNLFQSFSPGASIYLVHATIGKNSAGSAIGSVGNELYQQYNESVYLANSIVDTSCGSQRVVSRGGSVASGFCDSIEDVQFTPTATVVLSMSGSINLQPLQTGNSTLPDYMVQPIPATSSAAGIGVGGPYNCDNQYILRRDQNLAPRPKSPKACSAGALETGAVPSQFNSVPGPGLVPFPLVDFESHQTQSQATILLKNTGGGALNWHVQYDFPSATGAYFINLQQQPSGTLYAGQSTPLTFVCTPPVEGDYWEDISVLSDADNQKQASYQLRCTGVGRSQQAIMSRQPGPTSQPSAPPGQAEHTSLMVSNPASALQNLTVNAGWAKPGPMWGAPAMLGPSGPSKPTASIPPGGSASFDVACTPATYGLFVNTLVITSDDPNNPTTNYDVSCEAAVDNPAEDLQTGPSYPNSGTQFEGVAVSPDGSRVVAGSFQSFFIYLYSRNASNGSLNSVGLCGCVKTASNWTGIYGLAYSHDGQNLYATSQDLNAVGTWSTSNLGALPDVWAYGDGYTCGPGPACITHTLQHARGIAVSPDDAYVYVTGDTPGDLSVFSRNAGGGLYYTQGFTRTIGGVNVLRGADRVTTSPDGNFVYVTAYYDNDVAVFQRNPDGSLSFQSATPLGTSAAPTDLVASPDGNFLYVAVSGKGVIDTFNRSSGDGGLTLSTVITPDGPGAPWGIAITNDPAGRRVFLADYGDNFAQVEGRNGTSGALGYVDRWATDGPVFAAVSPDNLHVYMTQWSNVNPGSGGLQAFRTVENIPVASHLSPASILEGSGDFTLTVVGGRFYANSQVMWNGSALPTTFVDEQTLLASVPAGDVAAAGNPNVTIHNPAPGGGDSAALAFAVLPPAQPPVPSISSTNPPEAEFGSSDLLVFVYGANFEPDSVVYYNHQALPTTFVSDQTLQVSLSADILAEPGSGGLEVVNGGGAPALNGPSLPSTSKSSTIVAFKVSRPGQPARPALTDLSPASVVSGTASLWLLVQGHNFSDDPAAQSVGRWNGQARTSIVVDANTLLMQLTKHDLAAPANAVVTVLTPGTGVSGPLSFRVRAANEKPIPVVAGTTLDGWTLYVNGSDFVSGAQLRINGVTRATTYVNQYQLKTTLTLADHSGLVTVTNPGPGGGLSNALVAVWDRLFLPLLRH